jgi:hypothetical protein
MSGPSGRSFRTVAPWLLAATLAATCVPVALAQQPPTLLHVGSYPWLDLASTMAGDLDGDGVDDLVVASSDHHFEHAQQVTAWSGATQQVLWQQTWTEEAGFAAAVVDVADADGDGVRDVVALGSLGVSLLSGDDGSTLWTRADAASYLDGRLARAGDLDGDGVEEVLVGTPYGPWPGSARVHSGATGSVLFLFAAPPDAMAFGAAVVAPGDIDLDGYGELAVADVHETVPGHSTVTVYSGRSGSVIHVLHGDTTPWYYGDQFGRALADPGDLNLDGTPDLAVGLASDLSADGLGLVRVYSGADATLILGLPDFGWVLSGPGDVDFDGRPDLVLGSPYDPPAGLVCVVSGEDGTELARVEGAVAGDYFGLSLRRAGDFDGDGAPDLLVSGCLYAEVLRGPFVAPSGGPLLEWTGAVGNSFGAAVAVVGDADGDGVADVAAGAPGHGDGGSEAGLVRLFSGHDGALLWERAGDAPGLHLGAALSAVGDLDGDGRADVLAGAPQDGGVSGPGLAWALSGADGGVLAAWQGVAAGEQLGWAVAGPGDLDGDGVPDLAFGAPMADTEKEDVGEAQVVSGASGLSLFTLAGSAKKSHMGWALAAAGDVDGDGLPDLLAGEPDAKLGTGQFAPRPGFVHVLRGSGAAVHMLIGPPDGANFGAALSSAGDIDADGFADALVGAPIGGGMGGMFGARASLHAGADGAVLIEVGEGEAGASVGEAVAGGGDIDADGWPDVLIGSPGSWTAEVHLLSGDGLKLSNFVDSQPAVAGQGAALAVSDLDDDGFADAVIGAPATGTTLPGNVIVESLAPRWKSMDAGVPGAAAAPALSPKGSLLLGTQVELRLTGAAPSSPGRLYLGLSASGIPFKGGILVPAADAIVGFVTDVAGATAFGGTWPGGLPSGSRLYAQAWIVDAGAVQGVAASNALLGTVP